ncbi:MAG: FadR/GntR family transcriptional regulator [Pseudomonadota bacterium]
MALRRSDLVYRDLADAIQKGTFSKGERLPSEKALTEKYCVSRPTIREALARLHKDEVITSRQGSGAYVRQATSRIKTIAPLDSIADLRRCFEYRLGIETEAARLAADRCTPEDIARLHDLHRAMDQANAQAKRGSEEDIAFHMAVAHASGNRFFAAGLEQVRAHIAQGISINRTLSLEGTSARRALVQDEHRQLIAAIERGDGKAAAAAMATHLTGAMTRLIEG